MKQYKFNQKDLERLYNTLQVNDDFWWIEAKIDEWVESLDKQEFNLEIDSKPLTLEEKVKKTTLLNLS